jgi:hypothetical protein
MANTERIGTMRGSNPMKKRSDFVFRNCTYAEGWVQIDTNQDASYYRMWCHPVKRQIVSYHDGHITITRCTDDETFVAEMRRTAELNREWGYWIGIDAGEDQRHRFIHLGLADLLH